MMAVAAAPLTERVRSVFALAGRAVEMTLDRELAGALLAPFAHLPLTGDHSRPALRIDAAHGEAAPPAGEVQWNFLGHRVAASRGGRIVTHFVSDSGSQWAFDRAEQRISATVRGADRLSLYERGKTAQLLLPFWLESQGLELIHAALVARGGRGVLMTGPNGAGKSTAALACLAAGFDYLGDDYIIIERAEGAFRGHSVYGGAFLHPDHLPRFPELAPHAIASPYAIEDKRLVLLNRVYPGRIASSVKLEYLLLPRIGSKPASISRATKAEALRQLAPSSLLMLSRPGNAALAGMARLVETLECHWLNLGPDIEAIPRRVAELLDRR